MTLSPDEFRDALKLRSEQREEFRREVERHVEPSIKAAHETDKSAIELGQSLLKTSTLLNGGALVAIPAVVTLFGINVQAITLNLLIAGGIFALGLVFSWLSGSAGFFALSNRADRDYRTAEATRQNLLRFYYPPNDATLEAEATAEFQSQTEQATRHNKRFVRFRVAAIIFSVLSLAAFVGGNFVGGWSVLHAPLRAVLLTARTKPPAECATAKNAEECADTLKKLGKNPFDAFGSVGSEPVYGEQK
jgi:hypothetical protein